MNKLLTFVCGFVLIASLSCRRAQTEFVTIALPDSFSTLDTLTTTASDSAAERVRNLLFNSLVKKDQNFDYVGELASEINPSEDGKTITFTLREGVKFHNGKDFTSADVKYTFDELFKSNGYKAGAFFDTVDGTRVPHILSLETPDPKTVVFVVGRPALKNQLLSNLVAIPIIPEGTAGQQTNQPVGSGPFKFVGFDQSQNVVELQAHADYFEGAPKVPKIRIKTVTDASALQAELQTGGVDIAPLPSNLPPDTLVSLGNLSNLKVEQFEGSNIQYIGLNTQSPPLDNVKVRQAIGYAIDREKIIKELLLGQAKIAHSVLPTQSWAYSPGTEYRYDPAKARQLLKEAGYKNVPIKFKYAASNAAFGQYAQAIQNSLKDIGLNVEIETLDPGTLRKQLAQGQFQLNTGVWIGGNQDPIFFKDLFTTERIPGANVPCCNRSRYSKSEVDEIIDQAINETDRNRAKELYIRAWELISSDLPLFPLWYPANMVVANKRVGNISVSPSGDWSFVKNITVNN
ncbi:MAG: ABC transporter substrate-binding protein [Blastocatellia bacterium]|nr:ABC transporter substrate-binding protein [Blastocatellia bacterium]